MTPLRQRMIREMELRRFSPNTIECYVRAIFDLAAHYHRSPEQLGLEEVRSYLHTLMVQRHFAPATCNLRAAAITFLYRQVLGQTAFDLKMRRKHGGRLPEIYSHEELVRLFNAALNLQHRVLLMTSYAAGLRRSEVIRLRSRHIHSQRMLIHVEQGKGAKDRYTLLSANLLQELRRYWKEYHLHDWLFPNHSGDGPITGHTAHRMFYCAKSRAQLTRGHGLHTLRHCFATHLLEAGVNLRTLQLLLGHRNINTTTIYLHVSQKQLSQLHSAFDLLRLPQPQDVPQSPPQPPGPAPQG